MTKLKITTDDVKRELQRRRENVLGQFFPIKDHDGYSKHLEFMANGEIYRERCMIAANRVGKTMVGAYEVTCHATGIYPEWWVGKRFSKPVNCLVSGETAKLVRDSIQQKLLGQINEIGTGMIPKACIIDKKPKQGISDAIDLVYIKHTAGISVIQFQSYDQGRKAFQATERDVVWFDEEPPLDIYSEGLIRTMTTNGIVISTFTPLRGMSETVMTLQAKAESGIAYLVNLTWDDAPHLSQKDKDDLWNALSPHERNARSKGIPSLGSGAIYQVDEDSFRVDPFPIPEHFEWCYGMDVGWNNTAFAFIAYDRDNQTAYIVGEYKQGGVQPAVHAEVPKSYGNIVGAIDPASGASGQKDGDNLLRVYTELGLDLVKADNAVSAGILKVYQMLSEGRLKVFSTCGKFFNEFRLYRRDERGNIVKENDHIMDAVRYAVMTGLDHAKPKTKGAKIVKDPYEYQGGRKGGAFRF